MQRVSADLRADVNEQLLAQVQPSQAAGAMSVEPMGSTASASPDQVIDPAIAGQVMNIAGPGEANSADERQADGTSRKISRRELSSSKRAAQNRAAQVCGHHLIGCC